MLNRRHLLAAPALFAAPSLARAQAWPARPIRMVVPWPPGQATDVGGRVIAQLLGERLGQTIVPENRAGAGGSIGTDAVVKAPPDGYTILAASSGPILFGPLVQRLPYDVDRDLALVAQFGTNPFLLLVRGNSPIADAATLVARLKAAPGQLSFASSGIGGSQHLVTELFLASAGVQALHVPFQGSGPAIAAMLGGQTDFAFDTPAAAWALVRDGQLRALGVSLGRPTSVAPGVLPVATTANLPGFDVGAFLGLAAPAATPRPILARLEAEAGAIAESAVLKERFAAIFTEVDVKDGAGFSALLREQRKLFGELVQKLGIRAN
jgi:tripartite-type tricarboxylate transporter receptor subunit TctC